MNKNTNQEQREASREAAQVDEAAIREAELREVRDMLHERWALKSGPYNAYISMYSLGLTLLQLVELYDNQPGREQRIEVLDEFAKQVNKFTALRQK
jgi:hypothetical protein